jgi:glucose-6-phosphate-specific signal transduction histidine kinase
VTISIEHHDGGLRVTVADDGHGRGGGETGGRGVLGMQERAALLGGLLTAGPHSGGGFHVTADLPVPAALVRDRIVVARPPGAPAADLDPAGGR